MNWRRLWEWGGGYPLAFAAVAVVIAACIPFRGQYGVQTFMILFVPVIVVVARFAGTRPSAFASVLAVLTLDFLFTEPYYHLTISDPAEWIALAVFLVVALIAGQQTGRLREREQAAVRRQRELTLLNRLSFHVVSDKSVGTAAELTVSQVTALLGAGRVAVYARSDPEKVGLIASTGEEGADDENEFVDWVMQTDKAIGLPPLLSASLEPRPVGVGPDEAIGGHVADGVYLPLQTTEGLEGVLYARTHFDSDTPEEDVRFLVAVANLAGAALERKRLEAETAALTLEREAENPRLRASRLCSLRKTSCRRSGFTGSCWVCQETSPDSTPRSLTWLTCRGLNPTRGARNPSCMRRLRSWGRCHLSSPPSSALGSTSTSRT